MATKRQRSSESWEFVVRRRGVLPKPLYLTFKNPEEGEANCKRLEALLDRGIVPDEFKRQAGGIVNLADAMDAYPLGTVTKTPQPRSSVKRSASPGKTGKNAMRFELA